MKEIELKIIKPWHAFKVLVLMIAIILLVLGIIISSYGLVVKGIDSFWKGLLGTLIIVVTTAPLYSLIAVVIIWLYNLIAKLIGGFKFDIEEE